MINAFAKANAGRPQLTVTLPGSGTAVPALTALKEWVRLGIRTPQAPIPGDVGGPNPADIGTGFQLFENQGCAGCHGAPLFTSSIKDFTSPPPAAEIFTETNPAPVIGNPVGAQYLNRFLTDINSFNIGVPGAGNDLGNNIGGVEKASSAIVGGVTQPAQDGLGRDYNNDGRGIGFSPQSLHRHRRLAAVLPQRRLRDTRLRPLRRPAPHRQGRAAGHPDELGRPGQGRRLPRLDRHRSVGGAPQGVIFAASFRS